MASLTGSEGTLDRLSKSIAPSFSKMSSFNLISSSVYVLMLALIGVPLPSRSSRRRQARLLQLVQSAKNGSSF